MPELQGIKLSHWLRYRIRKWYQQIHRAAVTIFEAATVWTINRRQSKVAMEHFSIDFLLLITINIMASFWESVAQQTGREIKSNTGLKELWSPSLFPFISCSSLFLFALFLLSPGLKLARPQKNYLRGEIRRKLVRIFKAVWSLFHPFHGLLLVHTPHEVRLFARRNSFIQVTSKRYHRGPGPVTSEDVLPGKTLSDLQDGSYVGWNLQKEILIAVLLLGHQMASLSRWDSL